MTDVFVYATDCVAFLRALPTAKVDAIVTDPPYGLGFMGHAWDHAIPGPEVWAEACRVAKPGAHLVAFGGTRTAHRLACAIEDAGWEIRDTLAWMYGQGFPKSHNIGDGRGTALKPAHEPIILARKPVVGTVAENVTRFGTGALNIDACRIPALDPKGGASYANGTTRQPGSPRAASEGFAQKSGNPRDGLGRWPANVVLDEEAAAALDAQTGVLASGNVTRAYSATLETSVALGKKRRDLHPGKVFADAGGASRFFYCAKASRSERTHRGAVDNDHPTVKPLTLMRWLVRLVTPPGGLILDLFAGSGTTGLAGLEEDFSVLLLEKDARAVEIIKARISAWKAEHRR